MKNKILGVPAAAVLLISVFSCADDTAKITGQSLGPESRKVRLEETLSDGYKVVDSTLTDAQGNYKFSVKLPEAQPTFYNLRIDDEVIPLLVSAGEKVKIFSLPGNARSYEIEGSQGSALIKNVNDILRHGAEKLDSIAEAHSLHSGIRTADRREALMEYASEYRKIKREHIRFIVENSSSLAAIYAIEQRMPGDRSLFDGNNDIVYYQMVVDSVSKSYPGSRYLALLKNKIDNARAGEEVLAQFSESLKSPVSFPEISLPDIYGAVHNLSDNTGKVILLDFWSAAEAMAAVINAEYREIYDDYADKGFVIYQINIGTLKPVWVNAVLDQNLPWISVSDLKGPASPVMGNYNITKVPANFLINADGDIVAKDLFGDNLRKKVSQLTIGN